MKRHKGLYVILVIVLILVLDQAIKIYVKTHLALYENIRITDWFYIYFVENNGMALGIEVLNKIFLTLFRMVASAAIAYYICTLVKKDYRLNYILCVGLIFAGAVGNIIDSVFYGLLFTDSAGHVATMFPAGGGYASLLHGRVVDMFYFPIIKTTLPQWIPFGEGGQEFIFFRPIFNLSDASISVGVIVLLLFFRKTFSMSFEKSKINK